MVQHYCQPTPDRRAMIVFTSGTTSQPKGAVTTHGNIAAQITALIDAWAWQSDDVIPLFTAAPRARNHQCAQLCSLGRRHGARVAQAQSRALCAQVADTYSLFMAVPTIYVKLIDYLQRLDDQQLDAICEGFANMRLNVSGSAACPTGVFEVASSDWSGITGALRYD